MTLGELLKYLNCEGEQIEIVEPGQSWGSYSTLRPDSKLLEPFDDYEIDSLGAIAEDVIRVRIGSPKLKKEGETNAI